MTPLRAERVVPQGTLVAIGGNEDKKTDLTVLKAVCELPEGGTKVVEVIPTASSIPEETGGQYIEVFRTVGAKTVNIMDIQSREAANDPANVQRILEADVVFFTGGDQLRITNLLGGSAVLQTLLGHYQRGGVIAGTSAGAAAMSQAMIYQGKAGTAMRKGTVQMSPGLGLIRNAVVDSHFTQRGRFSRLLEVVTGNPGVIGIGLDEDSAVVVRDGTKLEAIGSGIIVLVDGHEMRYSNITDVQMGTPIAEEGIMLHTLTPGHGYDLEERRYIRPATASKPSAEDS
ncbi:MAG: cyanophycinase [Thermoplasmatota archaeon]